MWVANWSVADTNLDNQLFAIVEQFRAGVMLMKLHLMQSVFDHRVLIVDQPQPRDVYEIMLEIF